MRFQDGSIPLLLAADAGNAAVCKELLQLLSDQQIKAQKMVSAVDRGILFIYFFICFQVTKDSALHIACRKRDHELCKLFIENAADVNLQNVTSLCCGYRKGTLVIVRFKYCCWF